MQATIEIGGNPNRTRDGDQLAQGAQRIVMAAVEGFAQRGYDGTSLRFIASRASVDAALIVHRFGSKLGVWYAAVDHVADRLAMALSSLAEEAVAGVQVDCRLLASTLEALVDLVCEAPVIAQFILKELVQQNDRFDHVWERLVRPMHDRVAPLFASYERNERTVAEPNVQFFAFAGALATSVAARRHLSKMVPEAADDAFFRAQLKAAIVDQFLTRLEGHR